MSMTDPLADMLTRIRNGSKARFEKVDLPSSKLKREIAKVLKEEGFIKNFKVVTEGQFEMIRVFLKYDANRKGVIHIRRVSRPGRRVYAGSDDIPSVMSGFGISILSTAQGLLTDRAARKAHIGGEVLCQVW